MNRFYILLAVAFSFVCVAAPTVRADDSAAIKARMSGRLAEVVSLKESGAVGENNTGYLSVRGSLDKAQAAVVAAENSDRKSVYEIIAKSTNSNLGTVGKTRAASIRKSAPKGTWVQLAGGSWTRAK